MELDLLVEAARQEREAKQLQSSLAALYHAENSGAGLVKLLRGTPRTGNAPSPALNGGLQ